MRSYIPEKYTEYINILKFVTVIGQETKRTAFFKGGMFEK